MCVQCILFSTKRLDNQSVGVLIYFIDFVDPWLSRKRKGKPLKRPAKKKMSTQEKIDSLIIKHSKSVTINSREQHAIPGALAIEKACSMKEELLRKIEELGERLPPNTLDQLIDELGGPENVAEVSLQYLFFS